MAIPRLFLVAAMLVACSGRERPMPGTSDTASTKAVASDARAPGTLTLPSGFSATVFADSLGGARHVVTAANGADPKQALDSAVKNIDANQKSNGYFQ